MKEFRAQIDVTFYAEDVDDALFRFGMHFVEMSHDPDTDHYLLLGGTISVESVEDAEAA